MGPAIETMNDRPLVSVIVPVFKHWEDLQACLDCLKQQTYSSEYFEVILVDNEGVNDQKLSAFRHENAIKLRIETQLVPGSYAARNQGASTAQGEILAFTDADCRPLKNWLEMGVHCLIEQNEAVVAGSIKVLPFRSDRPRFLDRFQQHYTFLQEENTFRGFGATANLMMHKKVFQQVGMFDESFFSGGDVDWGWRAQNFGYQVRYHPEIQVEHLASRSLWKLLLKNARVAAGVAGLNLKYPGRHAASMQAEAIVQFRRSRRDQNRKTFSFFSRIRVHLTFLCIRVVKKTATYFYLFGGGRLRQ